MPYSPPICRGNRKPSKNPGGPSIRQVCHKQGQCLAHMFDCTSG